MLAHTPTPDTTTASRQCIGSVGSVAMSPEATNDVCPYVRLAHMNTPTNNTQSRQDQPPTSVVVSKAVKIFLLLSSSSCWLRLLPSVCCCMHIVGCGRGWCRFDARTLFRAAFFFRYVGGRCRCWPGRHTRSSLHFFVGLDAYLLGRYEHAVAVSTPIQNLVQSSFCYVVLQRRR